MLDQEPQVSPTKKLDLSRFIFEKEQFEEAFSDTYQRDLFPYDDDAFLVQRLQEENRTLKKVPELKEEIEVALLADDDEAILEVANDITEARRQTAPEIKKPITAILSYLTLAQAINNYKFGLPDEEAPQARVNIITTLTAQKLSGDIPDAQVTDAFYSAHYLAVRMNALYQKTHNSIFFFYNIKLKGLTTELHRRDTALRYIEALPGDDPGPIARETLEKDSAYIGELFSEIQTSRQYGVKMAYTPDERGGSLVFSPPHDVREHFKDNLDIHELALQSPAVAEIVHSSKKHPQRLKLQPIEYNENEKLAAAVLSAEALAPYSMMVLGPDGELYLDKQCTISYAEIARTKGKYSAYRDLQATILAHYFDLTHALTPPSIKETDPSSPASNTSQRAPLDSIEKLVVPRIRALKSPEAAQAVTTPDQPKRSVRYHGVTWHVRTLPSGWQASPAAYERAEELGITLEPGETIVKAHHRGSKLLGEVAGHQFTGKS